ncbi:hypothetical protein RPB_4496 [Rhodopseudomonas palustris HaA2]|uniref:Methyltransferase domain-containing protein n=1 Tax=Rhodopseudomonas palustris (strain HaA2) TaxID=316058 RepID=Q2IRI1_RHOP2|nr:methyltransferase domain-containing protein [Rhodopseudomonas palustris]ABD09179.1 hypothetical protein RPB_4496 [Rhodopseudomonas palustris HaA2]
MNRKQFDLFDAAPIDYRRPLQPARTAMQRKEASPVARELLSSGTLQQFNVRTILDFGCGVGQDVAFYRAHGLVAAGYDPHPQFGFEEAPVGEYDLVSCLFVLNVIADDMERRQLCAKLFAHARDGGLLVVAARSPRAIEQEAHRKGWVRFRDGYLSSPKRGTFQRGISEGEIRACFGSVPLVLQSSPFSVRPDVSVLVFRKTATGKTKY